jgi:hypothetical protein
MAYLLAIPVIYYGTSHVASKILDISSSYVLKNELLHDDSEALLLAVTSILRKYKNMDNNHAAFKNKLLVEEGIDSLEYASKSTSSTWYKRNYAEENALLQRLQNDLERRLRLFLLVVNEL